MTKNAIKEILENHKKWLNAEDGGRRADLKGADLAGADLEGANLKYTNLNGADIDFSCLPLWCGGLDVHFDDRQLIQIAYHLVRNGLFSKNSSIETKKELAKLIDFANKFHRVDECGMIEYPKFDEDTNVRDKEGD